jgi:hypothetical protein
VQPVAPIDDLLIAACAWLAIGIRPDCSPPRNLRFISKILFPLGALVGVWRD